MTDDIVGAPASTGLSVRSIDTTEEIKNYYPATVRVVFQNVQEKFELEAITRVLEALPTLLAAMNESDSRERLSHFCQALQLDDWRANAHSEMLTTGRHLVEQFFKTVPVLTEEEVRQRIGVGHSIDLSDLMQVKYDGNTFYFADQFASDGSIHSECIECWRILKSDLSGSEWDRASWWFMSTGWLEGRCAPRDMFKEDPAGLLDAAKQEAIKNKY